VGGRSPHASVLPPAVALAAILDDHDAPEEA
jgi:hypothetical protein